MLVALLVLEILIGAILFLGLIGLVGSEIIVNHNIKKYGAWWGRMPRWLEKIVDFFAI